MRPAFCSRSAILASIPLNSSKLLFLSCLSGLSCVSTSTSLNTTCRPPPTVGITSPLYNLVVTSPCWSWVLVVSRYLLVLSLTTSAASSLLTLLLFQRTGCSTVVEGRGPPTEGLWSSQSSASVLLLLR